MNCRYVMGTFLTVSITGEDCSRLITIFLDEVQHLEELLSRYRPESELSQINRAAGQNAVAVSEETFQVIQQALHFAAESGGAFDPTVEPFGYRRVDLDPVARTVFLPSAELALDLGGIGKGFALDRALARVQEAGEPGSVSADFGGQLLFWHKSGSFAGKTIFVEDPLTQGVAEKFEVISNCSIATSSQVERPGHLRNPLTGDAPPRCGSVTVVARTGTEAEALSTAFFVQGRMGIHGLQ